MLCVQHEVNARLPRSKYPWLVHRPDGGGARCARRPNSASAVISLGILHLFPQQVELVLGVDEPGVDANLLLLPPDGGRMRPPPPGTLLAPLDEELARQQRLAAAPSPSQSALASSTVSSERPGASRSPATRADDVREVRGRDRVVLEGAADRRRTLLGSSSSRSRSSRARRDTCAPSSRPRRSPPVVRRREGERVSRQAMSGLLG